ncbi:hypothetical protein GCM10010399_63720 [Dactylosporangium fulvum]|uniref:Uncharacterized protein n=1 Tax=Dactylosporangium fulvum TaxID=53359 RepID=A0ABY5W8V7_9ACTN|nr:hypothetical protein [Dactylosporangium fulvum]UWP85805.1 hypothetical protein Dfulv_16795 [Dactylosporangium fulvum]
MTAKETRHCLCGSALHARSTPPAAAETIAALWEREHTGPGHGAATAAQAAQARRREEDRRERAWRAEAAG